MKDILNTYSATELKKFISQSNIKKYSKLKKNELITLMTKTEHINKFRYIKEKVKKERKKPAPAPKPTPKPTPAPKKKGRPDPEVQKRKLQQKIKDAGGKDAYLRNLGKETKGRQGAKIRALAEFQPKKKEKKPEPKGEKLIQFEVNDKQDMKTRLTHKIINSMNKDRVKQGKEQIKKVSDYLKEREEERKREVSEQRARTRARNQKKKDEAISKKESNIKTEKDLIDNFNNISVNDLKVVLGVSGVNNVLKNISSNKGAKNVFFVLPFMRQLGMDLSEKLVNKYGISKTWKMIEKMVKKERPNKQVFIPKNEGEAELKGFNNSLAKKIRNHFK